MNKSVTDDSKREQERLESVERLREYVRQQYEVRGPVLQAYDDSWGELRVVNGTGLKDRTSALLDIVMKKARAKFPRNRLLLAALTEEVGELAKALLQRQGRVAVQAEALQVAVVALRIYEEGDATFADVSDEEAQK